MRPESLSECLGHPIAALAHGSRTIFIPQNRGQSSI
jgi:hypothetical protein